VRSIISEPIRIHGAYKGHVEDRVKELMRITGLNPEHANRFPHEFSGGQRQRIGIARALAVNPKFIVADEPVSSLDVSIQAQIINLLQELQEKMHLTYFFISHDLRVVEHISHRVAIMYLGKVVEIAKSETIYQDAKHPYTRALLASVPMPDTSRKKEHVILQGDVPSAVHPPPGCAFHPRCAYREAICDKTEPPLDFAADGHGVACHVFGPIKRA
jgi:oligopeptide/dipeptide ABC transporter ATP-binding protein